MGMSKPFCGEGTPRQAAVMLSVFTLVSIVHMHHLAAGVSIHRPMCVGGVRRAGVQVGCILWLSWATYQIIWLQATIDGGTCPHTHSAAAGTCSQPAPCAPYVGEDVCHPNPCLHGGVCFSSNKGDNRMGYVCDCLGTGFEGVQCNASLVRRVSKKSCGEYYVEGQRNDGYYYIDPDGPSSNDMSPIRVRCQFRGNRAYTLVDHEYGGVRHFSQHYITDYAQSSKIEIRAHYLEYLNFDEQLDGTEGIELVKLYLDAIIDQAHHCEQQFRFRCRNWPLTGDGSTGAAFNTSIFGGLQYIAAVLEEASGSGSQEITPPTTTASPTTDAPLFPLSYDFGAPALDMSGEVPVLGDWAKCQCYLDNTCNNNDNSNDEYRCNCDKDEETWAEDVATLTKVKHRQYLPIGGVIIGTKASEDTDQEAYVELTPLSCYEEFDVVDPFSEGRNGGYGAPTSDKFSAWERDGFNIMWGCIIAFMVITALMLLASFIMLMGIMLNNGGTVVFWLVMVVIMNIMIFIQLCVRWYFLGFEWVVWELACQFLWMCITFYGMAAVVGYLDNIHGRQ